MGMCSKYRLLSLVIIFTLVCGFTFGQKVKGSKRELLYAENFEKPLNPEIWKAEIAPLPNSTVSVKNEKLVLDTEGGVTVWFNKELTEDIEIEYDWTVVVDGGKNDRLSDLNQFWMARDLRNDNLFTRSGKLEDYDSLALYYVGMGGNTNTTTRFRKYPGNGERVLIQEYLDKEHLLIANHTYKITITIQDGVSEFRVDGKKFFSCKDKNPLRKGYFGFRSTKSRHFIDNFKVFRVQ